MNVNDFSLLQSMARRPKVVFEKTHPSAKLPSKVSEKDVGWDFYSIEDVVLYPKSSCIVKVGLKLAYLDEGYWFKIESRSGLAFKNDIVAFQGVIDNQYRGEIGIKLFNFGENVYHVKNGDRIAQMVICYENIDFDIEWGKCISSERQDKGFGSSGK